MLAYPQMKKKISYALYLFFAIAFILEGGTRLYKTIQAATFQHDRYSNNLDDEYHYPRPYVMAAAKPFSSFVNDVHNILGYRGPLPTLPKPTSEFRVFLIGGSTVHGEVHSVSALLNEKNLKLNNKDVKFYNFGIGSSISRQDLIRIIVDLAGYSPDFIIHYGGGNDFLHFDDRINYPHRFSFYEKNYFFNKNSNILRDISFVLTRSEFLKYFAEDALVKMFFKPEESYFTDKKNVSYYRVLAYGSNLNMMNLLSQSIGSRFMAVFQPIVSYKPHQSDLEKSNIIFDSQETERQRNFIFQVMKAPKFNSTPFFDCSHIFDDVSEQIFRDFIHVDLNGQKMVVDCIAKNFESAVRKPAVKAEGVFIPEDLFVRGSDNFKSFLKDNLKIESIDL
jgi:hypothetical protein